MSALTRRYWHNLSLLGLVAGLVAIALLQPGIKPQEKQKTLLEQPPTQFQRITVERSAQESLAFEQREHRWWMTAPTPGPANPALLSPILHLADLACPSSYAASEINLPSIQLEPPRLRLRLDGLEVRFGTTHPLDGQRYVQSGNRVYLCPDTLYPLLISTAGSFVAPSIDTLMPAAGNNE